VNFYVIINNTSNIRQLKPLFAYVKTKLYESKLKKLNENLSA